MEESFIKISGTILGIIWFSSIILYFYFRSKNENEKFPMNLVATIFSFKKSNIFWKDIFNVSYSKYLNLTVILWIIRITLVVFLTIGFIWTFS